MIENLSDDEEINQAFLARRKKIQNYLFEDNRFQNELPKHLSEAAYSYVKAGGKYLRGILVMLSCGVVGGNDLISIPAAASIEVFHISSLVHDDIFDKDKKRRGVDSVHEEFRIKGQKSFNINHSLARHYGSSIGIITGMLQQGWAVSLLSHIDQQVSQEVTLSLVDNLMGTVLTELLSGETLDIQLSYQEISAISEAEILEMISKKTGAVMRYSAQAGAAIGLNKCNSRQSAHLADFAEKCGIAFQLRDDVLGIKGNEKKLGKSIKSDIKEGKRTLLIFYTFNKATDSEKKLISAVLGNSKATLGQIKDLVSVIDRVGAVNKTMRLAENYYESAMEDLTELPGSEYKKLLEKWADFAIKRKT